MKKIGVERNALDHALAALGGIFSTYSIGHSLGKPELANFLAIAVLVSSLFGYTFARLIKNPRKLAWDGYLWAFFGILSVTQVFRLNQLLPAEGFPWQLVAGGALSWMIIFGSLVSWRDQTLLFLSLPSLAIFGLVGTFDVYKPGTVLFFIFIVCIAVLYARVHQRSMLERARNAGVRETSLLWRDAWKWMAGPEWALASAGVIILISLVGAPVLQTSLQGVTGAVRVNLPNTLRRQPPATIGQNAEARIGQGPVNLSDRPVFRVTADRPYYFRRQSYSTYQRGGWTRQQLRDLRNQDIGRIRAIQPDEVELGPHRGVRLFEDDRPPGEPIQNAEPVRAELNYEDAMDPQVLAPGPIVEIFEKSNLFTYNSTGQVTMNNPPQRGGMALYYFLPPGRPDENTPARLPEFLDEIADIYTAPTDRLTQVRDLTQEVMQRQGSNASDYQKALAIKNEIEQRAKYNTNVPATPSGSDPVEHFLFTAREGYCDVFASAMVLMARQAGLPARYVIGYIVNDPVRDDKGQFIVREKDSHAWAEIYFEGKGWVIFDPTEGAEAVEGGERGSASDSSKPWYQRDWFRMLLNVLIGFAAIAPPLYWLGRRLLVKRVPKLMVTEAVLIQDRFQRAIERAVRSPRRFSQTLPEYVAAMAPKLGPAADDARELTRQFDSALFSGKDLNAEALKSLTAAVVAFRSKLKQLPKSK